MCVFMLACVFTTSIKVLLYLCVPFCVQYSMYSQQSYKLLIDHLLQHVTCNCTADQCNHVVIIFLHVHRYVTDKTSVLQMDYHCYVK